MIALCRPGDWFCVYGVSEDLWNHDIVIGFDDGGKDYPKPICRDGHTHVDIEDGDTINYIGLFTAAEIADPIRILAAVKDWWASAKGRRYAEFHKND